MVRALTSDELTLLRADGQWSRLYLAFLIPHTVYTARLASLPSSFDQVAQISVNTESGTLSDVKSGMTAYVGTTAGAHDLGMCRIRKAPITGTWYIGETSEIDWQGSCYLTIVDDFDLWAKHLHVESDGTLKADVDIAYSDQHTDFDPVPVLGSHAVLWLTGATVSVDFDASDSWVFDSTISAYAWTAPGSSASSGMSSATPTITYNAAGIYRVYCTVTAANGKTAFGVRYVFVYDDDNPPATVFQLGNCEDDVSAGGSMFDVTMQAEASLSEIRERTLCILFSRDWYGIPPDQTEQSIGPLEGRENIWAIGRVSGESIRWDSVAGQVQFTVYGPHYWMNRIKTNPCTLNFTANTPASWEEMPEMTVGRALWHLLHWRSNATQLMDFYPPGDARFASDFASLSNFLWTQLVEFAGLKILGNVLTNPYGQLFVEVEPQLVPETDRDWPTVMTVTKDDWMDSIDFMRDEVTEISQLNLTTRNVLANGDASTLYSLSPGHIPKRYGDWELHDGVLASTQAQSNQLAGLILGWKTNEFNNILIHLAQNNRMINICPHQFLALSIAAEDTPRGVAFDGNIIPRRVVRRYDQDTGSVVVEVSCEAETFEQLSANGDIPGSGEDADLSIPGLPPFPDLPPFPVILPGDIGFGDGGSGAPTAAILFDSVLGLLYTSNFGPTSNWITINGGIVSGRYQLINNFFVTPSGALFAAYCDSVDPGNYASRPFFVARAPSIGSTFATLYDEPAIRPSPVTGNWGLFAVNYNPLLAESVAFVMGVVNSTKKMWIGSGLIYAAGASVDPTNLVAAGAGLSYGFGNWLYMRPNHFSKIAPDGSSVVTMGSPPVSGLVVLGAPYSGHVRAGTTGRTFSGRQGGGYVVGENNLASYTEYNDSNFSGQGFASDSIGQYLMTTYAAGARGRSSDIGATWLTIPSLPFGSWWFANAGSSSRWAAAGGSTVRYTDDFGATWQDYTGDLLSGLLATHVKGIKVIG